MTQTQQVYRLEITEQERRDMIDMIGWQLREAFPREDVEARMTALLVRIVALTPVGTEGQG